MLMRRRGIKTTIAYNYNDTDVTVITPAITMKTVVWGRGRKMLATPSCMQIHIHCRHSRICTNSSKSTFYDARNTEKATDMMKTSCQSDTHHWLQWHFLQLILNCDPPSSSRALDAGFRRFINTYAQQSQCLHVRYSSDEHKSRLQIRHSTPSFFFLSFFPSFLLKNSLLDSEPVDIEINLFTAPTSKCCGRKRLKNAHHTGPKTLWLTCLLSCVSILVLLNATGEKGSGEELYGFKFRILTAWYIACMHIRQWRG